MSLSDVKDAIDKPFDFDKKELMPIFNKLVKDGYLNSFEIEALKTYSSNNTWTYNERYYEITFEGKIFIQTGGYVKHQEYRDAENIRLGKFESYQTRINVWIAAGTVSASIIALLLLLWETRHFLLRICHSWF